MEATAIPVKTAAAEAFEIRRTERREQKDAYVFALPAETGEIGCIDMEPNENAVNQGLASTVKQILDTVGEGIGLIASPSTFFGLVLSHHNGMGLNTGFDGYVTNLPAPVYIDTYVETYQTVKIYYNSANYYWAESVSLQGIRYLTLQQAEPGNSRLNSANSRAAKRFRLHRQTDGSPRSSRGG